MTRYPEHLRPVPTTPLRLRNGRLQQEHVVTRYHQDSGPELGHVAGRQKSQDVEWRYVTEG